MIKYCHKLQAPSCVEIDPLKGLVYIEGLGIPESHDEKTPLVKLP
jgi:hypothetical protein